MLKEFEQSYYTSCQKGLTSGPGFQTKAISPGISADTRRLMERFIGAYQLPAGRDRNVEEGQPASFKSFSLGRGKWCVSLTHYRRFDRKGALGNFFAHSLVCSREDFRDFGANPFLLYHSGYFKKEDSGTETELPVAPIEITPWPLRSSVEPLSGKIVDQNRLRQLIDAFLGSSALKRPVVIVMNPDDVLLVVEGVIALLPLSIRAEVSFSTYECTKPPARIEDPAFPDATQVMLCSGTTELRKARQSYSEIELDYSFLVFDFEESRFSKAPPSRQFSEWISGKVFEHDYRAIEQCMEFLSSFEATGKNIDEALSRYLQPDSVRGDGRVARSPTLPLKERLQVAAESTTPCKIDLAEGQEFPTWRGRDANRVNHDISDAAAGAPDQDLQAIWELPTVRRLLEPFASEFADIYCLKLNQEPKIERLDEIHIHFADSLIRQPNERLKLFKELDHEGRAKILACLSLHREFLDHACNCMETVESVLSQGQQPAEYFRFLVYFLTANPDLLNPILLKTRPARDQLTRLTGSYPYLTRLPK